MQLEKRACLKVGDYVLSLCGRDQGCVCVVIAGPTEEDDRVAIADGRHRKIEAPKRKKSKHLLPLQVAPYEESIDGEMTNRRLRVAIRRVLEECINDIA